MLILNGGDTMKAEVIISSNVKKFEDDLNEFLFELAQKEKEIVDIKYQTLLDESSGISCINHSALVLYK